MWAQQPIIGIKSDLKFNSYIHQADFTADSEKSVFTFMHLNGAHAHGSREDPASYGVQFNDESGNIYPGGTRLDTARVCFEILFYYFNKMKELGVYNNSTIILIADHGSDSNLGETASLIIKPSNSTGLLKRENITELSHKYFSASILSIAGLPYDEHGLSYFDLVDETTPPVRILYGYNNWFDQWAFWGSTSSLVLYGHYEINGDASNPDNWRFIPS